MSDLLERLKQGLPGRYRIEREIGSGGMAHVFLADDVKHGRKVALKVLRPDIGSAVGAERFLREIEIAARLSHPHILSLHDSGDLDGLLYYVMPYVEGESLRDRLRRDGKVPLRDALRIAANVAGALAYAHSRNVVHRDIKPENILLTGGYALVADFGIARAVSQAGAGQLTATGIAIGTVQYMSPEQAAGDPLDGRTDVYSLGTVLYEMLAGRTPFSGTSARAMMTMLVTEPAPPLGPEHLVPPEVAAVVNRSLARDSADRFTADVFAEVLEELTPTVSAPTATIRTTDHGSPRLRRSVVGTIAAVAVLAAGAVVWSAVHRPASDPHARADNRIAVLPFAVHGTQLQYLGHGIVDLLSRNLEGVDGLSAIDPGTVISSLQSGATTRVIDADAGEALGERFGAGWFVLGSVNPVGSRVRIQAALHRAGTREAVATAIAEGDSTELFALVDRLAGQLLVNRDPGAAQRLSRTAAITTHSLPALKAFLNAEQKLRGRAMDSAIAGYQRAIAEDSTFALAHYRLAVAAGWAERHAMSNQAVERGVLLANRLNERDRRLITAYAAYRRGAADDAERQYRAVLESYPDDLEAEFQLGDLLFQYNPLRGRPRLEARPLLDKVLALDPGFL
ncbi:MAG TPA: serine/threonine-protein kinase [Gemmatimonadaceae bacterium]|nr:serine/threonine-protein kinase [Gemmatimonadaceae bacterium]